MTKRTQRFIAFWSFLAVAVLFASLAITNLRNGSVAVVPALSIVASAFAFYCAVRLTN